MLESELKIFCVKSICSAIEQQPLTHTWKHFWGMTGLIQTAATLLILNTFGSGQCLMYAMQTLFFRSNVDVADF